MTSSKVRLFSCETRTIDEYVYDINRDSKLMGTIWRRFLIGIGYPTFKSFEAIKSPGSKDDTQWLTYWVVYSVYNFIETLLWVILAWIPLYGLVKVLALVWLVAPQFQGATYLYNAFIGDGLEMCADYLATVPALEDYVKPFTSAKKAGMRKKDDDIVDTAVSTPIRED